MVKFEDDDVFQYLFIIFYAILLFLSIEEDWKEHF